MDQSKLEPACYDEKAMVSSSVFPNVYAETDVIIGHFRRIYSALLYFCCGSAKTWKMTNGRRMMISSRTPLQFWNRWRLATRSHITP
jgi:hypothetical protein